METRVRKLIHTTILIVVIVLPSKAQLQEAISSSGGNFNSSSYIVSYTLGETVITTLNQENLILTQGFQQTRLIVTAINEMEGLTISINAYPNPVKDHLQITISEEPPNGSSYELFNIHGELIVKSQLNGRTTKVDFQSLVSSMYILRVIGNKQELKTFKIIKQ